jgi:hypothetical protein
LIIPNAILPQGRSTASGRHFNLAVVLDGELTPDGRPMGGAVAESTFHHFADYNWDLDCGAPSFVTARPGTEIKNDPSRLGGFQGLRPQHRDVAATPDQHRV